MLPLHDYEEPKGQTQMVVNGYPRRLLAKKPIPIL